MIREDAGLHRAQRAFRSVLDAFARPGTVHVVDPAANSPARPVALGASLEAVVRLFVDQAVTFCVADAESDATAAYLTGETLMTSCRVRVGSFVGLGLVLGGDRCRAYELAVVDAAFAGEAGTPRAECWDGRLRQELAHIEEREAAEARRVATTEVDFSTMKVEA